MLAHTVIFWLKNDLSEDQRNAFREGLESLKGIEYSKGLYWDAGSNQRSSHHRQIVSFRYYCCV